MPRIVDDLYRRFPDFRRAYDENGLPSTSSMRSRRRAGRCAVSRACDDLIAVAT